MKRMMADDIMKAFMISVDFSVACSEAYKVLASTGRYILLSITPVKINPRGCNLHVLFQIVAYCLVSCIGYVCLQCYCNVIRTDDGQALSKMPPIMKRSLPSQESARVIPYNYAIEDGTMEVRKL
jgi:hypothetical protein